MASKDRCPTCGGPLQTDDAGGRTCPACLLRLALEVAAEDLDAAPDAARATGVVRDPGAHRAAAEGGDLAAGSTVGRYRIVRQIGEGGMGVVYLAEQIEPVRRRVALKVIKHGLDTRQVVARFEVERQALALMDHPAIAQVYDAGETPDGRPYFAMEFVDGEPVTDHCDRERLGTRQRLGLFVKICEGIQHAHQKGIIHRDVKPSNVLVATRDGAPVPKIIDFGVAKAVEQRLTERSLFTEMGMLLGTPEYMSPEQAEMTPLDVDTRTDVYSLGVLLYELLTGALPLERDSLRSAAYGEMLRRIREEHPSKPSARISDLGVKAAEPARLRRSDAATLRRLLAGDLDVITLKALEKERERRYGSPAELAADLGRWLRNEPVLARPPSAWYLVSKLASRHRLPAILMVALFVTLVGFSAVMTLLYRQSQRNLERALAAEAAAEREAETTRRVSEFIVDVFEVSDPDTARGATVTARELLESGAQRIDTALRDQPEIRAELAATISQIYRKLGLHAQALPLAAEALETFRRLRGRDDPRALQIGDAIGVLHWLEGRWDEAEAVLGDTIERQRRVLGPDHIDTLRTRGDLASLLSDRGRYEEAEALYLEVLEAERRVHGEDHAETLKTMANLANTYREQTRYDDAARLIEQVVATQRRTLGDDHPDTLQAMHNLAMIYRFQGRVEEVEALLKETIASRTRVLGETHPKTLATMNGLASFYGESGRFDEAEPIFRRIIQMAGETGRAEHPETLVHTGNLAQLLKEMRRYRESEALFLQNLQVQKRVMGPEHPRTLSAMNNLANVYTETGQIEKAGKLYTEALALQRKVLGPDHRLTLRTLGNLAGIHNEQGRPDRAEPLMVEVMEGQNRVLGEGHPDTAITMHNLARLRRDSGNLEGARPLFEEAQRIFDAKHEPGHPHQLLNLREHAKLLGLAGDEAGARRLEAEADRREKQAGKP